MLDWLGDLGGLKEAIIIILTAVLAAINYNGFENYLVSKLYRGENEKDRFHSKQSIGKSGTSQYGAGIDDQTVVDDIDLQN